MRQLLNFRAAGVALVLLVEPPALPVVLHWGHDLGELGASDLEALAAVRRPWVGDSEVTYPGPVPLLPELARGWLERPGLRGTHPDGSGWSPRFQTVTVDSEEQSRHLHVEASDPGADLELALDVCLTEAGLVKVQGSLTNRSTADYAVEGLELCLPVPPRATQLLDFTGRWARERFPQRRPFDVGQWSREARGGKPGLEGAWVLSAGECGFDHARGEVWGMHVAWPGNQVVIAQRTPNDARVLGGGELLHSGEVVLRPGGSYTTPALLASHGEGLDAMSARYHDHVRANGRTPRCPVTWNSWEAVYFDHDEQHLMRCAEVAAQIGVERVVLDDGWFLGRRDDSTSLGDWVPDPLRWPRGLRPFSDHVHALGMEFGLWVEPEMVSPSSRLAEQHPDWLFDAGHGPGPTSRHQWVLNLAHPECYQFVFAGLHHIITEASVDALKWDHNRYLLDAGGGPNGRAAVHQQTVAYLRLVGELLDAHPHLEIEACASGGGRADLATMALASRMWPSDCNDPHDRLGILRGTALLLPPELIGTHIGASPDHITGRSSSMGFRGCIALWGQLGVEADLAKLSASQLDELRWWIELHRRFRPLLHSGRWVHAPSSGEEPFCGGFDQLDGVVAQDFSQALFCYAALERPATLPPPPLRFGGIDPGLRYRVETLGRELERAWLPPWMSEPLECAGSLLSVAGLEAPSLAPDSGVLILLTALA